jgi:hypothetical protein
MQDRGFGRYNGKDGRNKSGGHWTFEPRMREPWYRQALLGIAVAQRKRRYEDLAARKHCSPARKAKLLRRAKQAQRDLDTPPSVAT